MTQEKAMAIAKLMVEYVAKRNEYDNTESIWRRMILEDEYLSALEKAEALAASEVE